MPVRCAVQQGIVAVCGSVEGGSLTLAGELESAASESRSQKAGPLIALTTEVLD